VIITTPILTDQNDVSSVVGAKHWPVFDSCSPWALGGSDHSIQPEGLFIRNARVKLMLSRGTRYDVSFPGEKNIKPRVKVYRRVDPVNLLSGRSANELRVTGNG